MYSLPCRRHGIQKHHLKIIGQRWKIISLSQLLTFSDSYSPSNIHQCCRLQYICRSLLIATKFHISPNLVEYKLLFFSNPETSMLQNKAPASFSFSRIPMVILSKHSQLLGTGFYLKTLLIRERLRKRERKMEGGGWRQYLESLKGILRK